MEVRFEAGEGPVLPRPIRDAAGAAELRHPDMESTLGFVMDAFEIIFVVVPIVAVPLLKLHGVDPVWLGVMMAMNLQTSYMHPPLGPTLFFLRGVAPTRQCRQAKCTYLGQSTSNPPETEQSAIRASDRGGERRLWRS